MAKERIPIIDCDVHPSVANHDLVMPYMAKAWRRVFEDAEYTVVGRTPDRLPYPYNRDLRADARTPNGGPEGSDAAFTAKQLLDRYQIDRALLLPMQPGVVANWTDAERASVYVRAMNDYFLDNWVGLDDRYRMALTVSPLDPNQAGREIRRYAGRYGIAAIWLPLLNLALGDRHYYPILKAAADCGLPVVFHPNGAEGNALASPGFAAGRPNQYPEWKSLLPQIAQSALASAIFEGVFERYPNLKVIFVEFGFSWVAASLWRMDQNWRDLRSVVPWVTKRPSEYVLESVRFTTQPMDDRDRPEELWSMLDLMHADRILMFSSDYPHYDNDDPFRSLGKLPDRLRMQIAHGNARSTFGDRLGLEPIAAAAPVA